MKRSAAQRRTVPRARGHAPGGQPGHSSAALTGAEFVTLLKREQVADPHNAELRAGRAVRARPLTGQAAGVLQRLEQLLVQACAGTALQVRARPLVRLGPADLWRPHLGLMPARETSTIHASGATTEAASSRLIVLVGRGEVGPERLAGYAAAGVGELWSVSLCAGWTVRYRSPWAGRYQSRTLWYPGEGVPVAALSGAPVEALEEGFQPAGLFAGGPDCGGRP